MAMGFVRRNSSDRQTHSMLFEQGIQVGRGLIVQGQSYRDNYQWYDRRWSQAHAAGDWDLMSYYGGVMRGLELEQMERNAATVRA